MAAAEASVAAAMVLTSVAMHGGGGYGNPRRLWRVAACGDVWHRVGRQQRRAALPSWSLSSAGGGGGGEGRRQQSRMPSSLGDVIVLCRLLWWGVELNYAGAPYDVVIGPDVVASPYDPVALAQMFHA